MDLSGATDLNGVEGSASGAGSAGGEVKNRAGNLRGKRSYSVEFKEKGVRMVSQLRAELGTSRGTVKRVADQLGVNQNTLWSWVRQAEVDSGDRSGVSTGESEETRRLRQENRELRRANEILRAASVFFAAELDGQPKK
jgi:transposase-like protein